MVSGESPYAPDMPTTEPEHRPTLPPAQLDNKQRAALNDTPAHTAATALAVAGSLCPDPVRARNATALFPVAADTADSGDGAEVRRRSGMVVALVESAAAADPSCRPLMLALERWMLHPGRDTADELSSAAAAYIVNASDDQLRAAWSVGAGLDAAIEEINAVGIQAAGDEAIAAVEEACTHVVSHTWVAQRCGISRDAIYRRSRGLRVVPITIERI
jgi:hypothetical protein